jgi:hypothetical protein
VARAAPAASRTRSVKVCSAAHVAGIREEAMERGEACQLHPRLLCCDNRQHWSCRSLHQLFGCMELLRTNWTCCSGVLDSAAIPLCMGVRSRAVLAIRRQCWRSGSTISDSRLFFVNGLGRASLLLRIRPDQPAAVLCAGC